MSSENDITHVEADDLHETHATDFQVAGNEKEVILTVGEIEITVTPDGMAEADRIIYDTKVRMDPTTAHELLELLRQTIDVREGVAGPDVDVDGPGRGVQ